MDVTDLLWAAAAWLVMLGLPSLVLGTLLNVL